ncbi:MAG: hypothetical protein AMJ56_20160 [Anaerolineae bacterium SG8_19]|nr:MAG: hypothetical protein AMJ56_20160 [Anaerolineae bacterium SG8_19]
MKKYTRFLVLTVFFILILALTAGQAVARPKITRVFYRDTFCSIDSDLDSIWFYENIVHGRSKLTSISESSDPRFSGTNDIVANWMFNTETGKGFESGTFDLSASDSRSSWAGIWSGRAYLSSVIMENGLAWGLLDGYGTGYGTGSYFGLQYYFVMHHSVEVYETTEEALASAPCITGLTEDLKPFVAQSEVTAFIRQIRD